MRDRFTAIIGRLSRAVATYALRQSQGPSYVLVGTQMYVQAVPPSPHLPIPPATWNLLAARLGRLAQRVRDLFARLEAGTLVPPRIRPPPIRPLATKPATPHPPYPRLPTASGWINARIPDAAPCAGALEMLLQDPATPGLLARAPQAGRLLRPLCRALAVDLPAYLRLPPRQASSEPAGTRNPRPARPPRPRPMPFPPGREIPRHVLAAARAWKTRNG